jgi:hypothetical protein
MVSSNRWLAIALMDKERSTACAAYTQLLLDTSAGFHSTPAADQYARCWAQQVCMHADLPLPLPLPPLLQALLQPLHLESSQSLLLLLLPLLLL